MHTEAILPIYRINLKSKDKYESIGTGVLITYRNQTFLVTAAHIIDELQGYNSFFMMAGKSHDLTQFPIITSNIEQYTRDDDFIDIAVVLIQQYLIENNITVYSIKEEQWVDGVNVDSNLFQAVGYPNVKNTKQANRTAKTVGGFKSEALRFTMSEINNESFPKFKFFNAGLHIATQLDTHGKKSKSDVSMQIPDLRGMSGGLLQKVCNFNIERDDFDLAYPAGIIIEKNSTKSAMFAIKFSGITEWLDYHWPDIMTFDGLSKTKIEDKKFEAINLLQYRYTSGKITHSIDASQSRSRSISNLRYFYHLILMHKNSDGSNEIFAGLVIRCNVRLDNIMGDELLKTCIADIPELVEKFQQPVILKAFKISTANEDALSEQEMLDKITVDIFVTELTKTS